MPVITLDITVDSGVTAEELAYAMGAYFHGIQRIVHSGEDITEADPDVDVHRPIAYGKNNSIY